MKASPEVLAIGQERQLLARFVGVLADPDAVAAAARSAVFSRLTPLYPGVRAPVSEEVEATLRACVSAAAPLFGFAPTSWRGQSWYSLVTTAPERLAPIQRLPHIDGTDPNQLAALLYLNHTDHGGTNFFRHRATGFELLNPERWPIYEARVQAEIAQTGLPAPAYVTDGAPHFERIFAAPATYNSLVVYRGCTLHSGAIAANTPLSDDPLQGRLTINGFFTPAT